VTDEPTATDIQLFGSLFVLMERLMLRAEEHLQPLGLTTRQWLLLGVLEKAFPGHAPTISEATAVFGTSRQNVKQVARQLERGGWLRLEPDPADGRMVRLVLTDQLAVFDDPQVRADQAAFILTLFGAFTERERRTFLDMVTTCIDRLSPPPGDTPTNGREPP
jgi:DNA-binding MarR family transcriptional regulator